MKKERVKLGGTYLAKVSDKVVPVRLDAESPHGGWQAFNLETHKTVRIKSAQRLRGPATDGQAKQRGKAVKTDAKGTKTTTVDAGGGIMVDVVEQNAAAAPAAKKTKTPKAPKEPKVKKTSGLDLAAQVLKDKGEAMNAKDIADAVIAAGWQTNGKTPHATLYSAMLREIDAKPGEARFAKTGRGLFALANAKA